jgi:hypothetical protein
MPSELVLLSGLRFSRKMPLSISSHFSFGTSVCCVPSVLREQNTESHKAGTTSLGSRALPQHSAPKWDFELWYVRMPCNIDLLLQELLKKVLPYHCLGYICSQQDSKGKKHLASTIDDIFTHINNVITCVITTCLGDKSMKEIDRVKVVEHWIQVAMVCD